MSARDSVLKVDPMKSTRVVARLLGGMLFMSGAGILLNSEGYRATADEFLRGVGLIYMSGIMALVAGLAIVNLHNVWTRDWRILVTLIGWFAVDRRHPPRRGAAVHRRGSTPGISPSPAF